MSRILAAAALGVAVVLVPAAAALTPPRLPTVTVPTVSTPAVTTPAVTTPVVTVPGVTVPPVTTPVATTPPVSTPAVTAPTVTVPSRRVPVPSPALRPPSPPQTPAPIVPAASAPVPAPASAPSDGAFVGVPAPAAQDGYSYPTSSRRSSGNRDSRSLPATGFHLARAATVHVTVWQETPRCRLFGRYSTAGARGSNTLRLPKRIDGHRLRIGTYRLVGLVHGREVIDRHVRVERAHGRLHVRKTDADADADVCLPAPEEANLSAAAVFPISSIGPGNETGNESGKTATSGVRGAEKSGSSQTEATGPQSTNPIGPRLSAAVSHALLLVLLGLAIALLAVSALPESLLRNGSAAAALTRHRAALTSAGLAMIVAAALAAALG